MGKITTIEIDGVNIKFKASAAVPRLYRLKFGSDIFKDMASLKTITDDDTNLPDTAMETFENIAYIMAKHAVPEAVPDDPAEWLEQFETMSIYKVLPELINLWGVNMETQSKSKKKSAKPSEK